MPVTVLSATETRLLAESKVKLLVMDESHDAATGALQIYELLTAQIANTELKVPRFK